MTSCDKTAAAHQHHAPRADAVMLSDWTAVPPSEMHAQSLMYPPQPHVMADIAPAPGLQHGPQPTSARTAAAVQRRVAGSGCGTGGGRAAVTSSAVDKRLARALRNRESARRSRLKSKLRVQGLEIAFASLKEENCVLRNALCHILPACLQRSPRLRSQLGSLLVELKLLA